ncbi:hypothetical protein OG874_08425 [Nocardia sp. NBC_00565]|uniref:hypothetical protein n=1 Tax=Nocardia sp. NBC_00565 TaxID=2975993 RepID=UPI002E8000AD|nr:hypothetical protein [Nocardia sp. NBC_00565]WUC05158.1 hypothetical protein OG874_08425 [Nocardia sp. NBC_00565]
MEADQVPPPGLARLATTSLPIYSGFSVTAVDSSGRSLNDLAVHVLDCKKQHWVGHYHEEADVGYCLRSALYRLDRIVGFYVEKCKLFEQKHQNAIRGNTGDARVYFEVDALLSDVRRVYEAISKLLWKHYAPKSQSGSRWRSVKGAVGSTGIIPEPFGEVLRTSWKTVGVSANEYRDCLMHYVPLTDGAATLWMDRYGRRWGATVRLPAQPEKRSRKGYDLENGPDALAYCHSLVIELVTLGEQLAAQDRIAEYLANPPTERPS